MSRVRGWRQGASLAYVSPRRRRTAVLGLGVVFLSTIFAAEACLAPTQVTVVVETDVPCGELKGVTLTVSDRPEGAETKGFVTAETGECQAGGRVGTLVLTPSDSGRAAVVVVAGVTRPARACNAANGYEGCIVARRLVSFIDHTALVVPIRLEVDCLNVPCNAISTCSKGKCVSSETSCDGADCSKFGVASDGGTSVVEDAPTSNDATPPKDAPSDAPDDVVTPIDASHDAPVDGPINCAYTPGIPCNGGRCNVGQVCCQGSAFPYAERCADSGQCNTGAGERMLSCRSSADCTDSSQVCCMAPSYSYATCSSSCGTGTDGGGMFFGFQTCTATCPSCRTGTCTATTSGYASCQ